MFNQGIWKRELLRTLFTMKHLFMELLHMHPVHTVALERQITSINYSIVVITYKTLRHIYNKRIQRRIQKIRVKYTGIGKNTVS